MKKVEFTKLEECDEIKHGYIYLAIVYDEDHENSDYQFLLYKDGDFKMWNVEESSYNELEENLEVVSIALLSKHGSEEF